MHIVSNSRCIFKYFPLHKNNDNSSNNFPGINNPEEIQKLKDHVISRLATAYSLEKMRRALDKLKQSVDNERHLERNNIEERNNINHEEESEQPSFDKEKRVAAKKENAQFDNSQ